MNFTGVFHAPFFLNLNRRIDRRKELERHFKLRDLKVERFVAIDGSKFRVLKNYSRAATYAVALTKRSLLRKARNQGSNVLFFFEDDVVLHKNWSDVLWNITLPEDWGVFFLGCQHLERPVVAGLGLVKASYPVDHHAIGIRAEYFDRIMRTWRVGNGKAGHEGTATELERTNSDVELARLAKEIPMYACYPNIAWQRKDLSDQTGRSYSNYTPEGDQLHCRDVLAGLGAEVLGCRRWQGLPLANQTPGRWDDAIKTGLPFAGAGIRDFMRDLSKRPLPSAPAEVKMGVLLMTRSGMHHPEIWQTFVDEVRAAGGKLLAHAKEPEMIQSSWHQRALIPERAESEGEGIGVTRAMLALLRAALENPDLTHFTFASESCVPIMPYREMRRQLRVDARPWLKVENLDALWKTNPEKAKRILTAPTVEKASWRSHGTGMVLDRETARLVTEDDLTEHFAKVPLAEECYIGTVLRLMGYPVEELCAQKNSTWTRSSGQGAHPETLTQVSQHRAGELARSGCFFARHFSPESNIGSYGLHLDEEGQHSGDPFVPAAGERGAVGLGAGGSVLETGGQNVRPPQVVPL
jgi:Core-2/I-Branching enzyme